MDTTAIAQALATGDMTRLVLAMDAQHAYAINVEGSPYPPLVVACAGRMAAMSANMDGTGLDLIQATSPDDARGRIEQLLTVIVNSRPWVTIRDLITDTVIHQGRVPTPADEAQALALTMQHIGLMAV